MAFASTVSLPTAAERNATPSRLVKVGGTTAAVLMPAALRAMAGAHRNARPLKVSSAVETLVTVLLKSM